MISDLSGRQHRVAQIWTQNSRTVRLANTLATQGHHWPAPAKPGTPSVFPPSRPSLSEWHTPCDSRVGPVQTVCLTPGGCHFLPPSPSCLPHEHSRLPSCAPWHKTSTFGCWFSDSDIQIRHHHRMVRDLKPALAINKTIRHPLPGCFVHQ